VGAFDISQPYGSSTDCYRLHESREIHATLEEIKRFRAFVIIKGHVICACLGFNNVVIQRQLMGIPVQITEMEEIKHI
jgi:hypothetical protein